MVELIIAAVGNNGYELTSILYPAAFQEVIAVGAVDSKLKRASYSSVGPEVDIVAPGSDIFSTVRREGMGHCPAPQWQRFMLEEGLL